MDLPTKQDIIDAAKRIRPFINRTPLLNNKTIDKLAQCNIWFKCQNFQKTGSFKVRGAANKILSLDEPKIIAAHSSGNHAQAIAYIAKQIGIKSAIVMSRDTPEVKKNAVRQYGGQIYETGPTQNELQQLLNKIQKQLKADLVHPYNDLKIITGAASIGMQVYEEISDFDYVVFPIGGGGLASGILLSTMHFSPKTIAVAVQPYLARDAYLSMKKGQIQPQFPPITLAEGVRTSLGNVNFQIVKKYLSDIILVSEEEMIQAGQLIFERMKILVELSSSLVLAAIIKDNRFKGKKVCAIISGGNVNISTHFDKIKSSL